MSVQAADDKSTIQKIKNRAHKRTLFLTCLNADQVIFIYFTLNFLTLIIFTIPPSTISPSIVTFFLSYLLPLIKLITSLFFSSAASNMYMLPSSVFSTLVWLGCLQTGFVPCYSSLASNS